MGKPMKIRAASNNGVTEVKVLMNHDMETGMRKDSSGAPIPAMFINDVVVKLNDAVVLQAQWGTAVAKNPYLAFKIKGGNPGDKITIAWTDSSGDSRSDEATVA